jgi:hypothetical protein
MLLSKVSGSSGYSKIPHGAQMSGQELGNVVFRVQFIDAHSESQLVAYDLISKAWYQSSTKPWDDHRKLLLQFGVGELHLSLADEAFATGTRDAQFAAVPVPRKTLDDAGFKPKIW